jgi:2-polyprenyl-3-methyl-5-hydroxy-6-metoxy-1,4-benzoquinol methylase
VIAAAPEALPDDEFLRVCGELPPAAWHHTLLEELRRRDVRGPVLDAGCNCGHVLLFLARSGLGPLTGIDIDPAATHKARILLDSEGVDAQVLTHDLTAPMPFDHGAFHTVVCTEVLEHIPEPSMVVRRLREVLSPGGLAIVTTPVSGRTAGCLDPRGADPDLLRPVEVSNFHWSEMSAGELEELFPDEDWSILKHSFFNLPGEGTLSNRGLRRLYRGAHRVGPLVRRLARGQLVVATPR